MHAESLLCMNAAYLLIVMLLHQAIVRILCDQRHRSVLFSIPTLVVSTADQHGAGLKLV